MRLEHRARHERRHEGGHDKGRLLERLLALVLVCGPPGKLALRRVGRGVRVRARWPGRMRLRFWNVVSARRIAEPRRRAAAAAPRRFVLLKRVAQLPLHKSLVSLYFMYSTQIYNVLHSCKLTHRTENG